VERVLLDQVIQTDYGQFDLGWADEFGFDGDFARVFAGQVNGLAGAAHPDGVYLNLARRSGGSALRIVLADSEPKVDETYQDVVEVSISIPSDAEVRWMSWAAGSYGLLDIPGGTYRMRVSARDRDLGRAGEFEEHPVDSYLVELWPGPIELDAIVRVGSDDAKYWHREVGARR
jgi:hypothetical protein